MVIYFPLGGYKDTVVKSVPLANSDPRATNRGILNKFLTHFLLAVVAAVVVCVAIVPVVVLDVATFE